MPQVNWEAVFESPVDGLRVFFLAGKSILSLLWSRLNGQPSATDLANAIKVRFLVAANTVNPALILSAPSHAIANTESIEAGGGVAFVPGGKAGLVTADAVLFYIHGGGFALGHPLQYRDTYRRWRDKAAAEGLKLAVVALQYRKWMCTIPSLRIAGC